jgi:hypothetical protein
MSEITEWSDEQIRAILFDRQGLTKYPGGLPVAAGARAIRDGDILAKETTGNTVIVCKRTELAAAEPQTETLILVDDAHPFEVADVVQIGDEATTLNVVSLNYDTNVITMGALTHATGQDVDAIFHVAALAQDDALGIALTGVYKRDAAASGLNVDLVTPASTVFYGDIAITGRFRLDQLRNFRAGNVMDTSLGGLELADNNTYVISTPSTNYSQT